MDRVCITINFFPIMGGARAIVADFWRTMHSAYEIHFLTIPPPDYVGEYMIHPLQKTRRHFVPCNPGLFPLNLLYVLWGTVKLLQLNKKYRFKAIIAQDGVFTGLYSAIAGKLTHTKVIIMDYGATTNYLSNSYWNFQRTVRNRGLLTIVNFHTFLLRSSARLAIRTTAKMADIFGILGYELVEIYHQMKIPDSKMRKIQYGVDENFFKPLEEGKDLRRKGLGIDPNSIVINATNRMSQDKGIEYLLPAMKEAIEHDDRIVCLLVGAGNMLDFATDFVKRNKLEDRIKFMGEATPREVRDLLQISDIFVYAAVSSSNIALAVLEAMATQLAVVATDSPRSHKYLLAESRGIAVPSKNASALAQSIIRLAENEKLRKEMAVKSRKYVLEHHASEAIKRRLVLLVKT